MKYSLNSGSSDAIASLILILLLSTAALTNAFAVNKLHPVLYRNHAIQSISSLQTPITQKKMTLTDVSDFYATYPVQSAVLTCGVKASVADGIAQFKVSRDMAALEARRNVAYIIYGGIFIGLMCHLEYNHLFPILFGTDHSTLTIVEKILFDNFISGPLLWLPPAYLIKAIIYDYSLKEGLEKYVTDVTENGLLTKYWTIWVPAQTISFSVIPDHLRVAFMASISFFWFILFSSLASKTNDDENAAAVADDS